MNRLLASIRLPWWVSVAAVMSAALGIYYLLTFTQPIGASGATNGPPPPQEDARSLALPLPAYPSQLWGYIPDNDWPIAWASAEAHRGILSGISLVLYRPDRGGNLVPYQTEMNLPNWLGAGTFPVIPVIQNYDRGWNRDLVAGILRDPGRRYNHIQQIVGLAVDGNYAGIELDYESLHADDRELFSTFVEELAQALHASQKQLSVAVHAKLAEPGEWGGAQAQNWARLGAAADRVTVMTYDYDPARPGPIAPLAWTQAVLRFAVSSIPPTKVIQGIPLYGYEWSGRSAGVDRTYSELQQLAQRHDVQWQRDLTDKHLTFEYAGGRARHVVWLVDATTVAALASIGREIGVAGYAVWRLGGEDPEVWSVLASPYR